MTGRSLAVGFFALLFCALSGQAHEPVVRHHPHAAESRKPHEAISHHPHEAASHPKPQKAPKHQTGPRAKAPKVPKH
jgi:hypothetical protein